MRSATSSPTPRTSCARRWPGCGCGSRRRARHRDAGAHEADRRRARRARPPPAIITELLVSPRRARLDAPARGRRPRRCGRARRPRAGRPRAAPRAPARRRPAVRCTRAGRPRPSLDALLENALPTATAASSSSRGPRPIEVPDDGPGLDRPRAGGGVRALPPRPPRPAGPPGTGLGLPIARELAARWGGDVTLANRDGGGARARVTRPNFSRGLTEPLPRRCTECPRTFSVDPCPRGRRRPAVAGVTAAARPRCRRKRLGLSSEPLSAGSSS